MTTIYADNAATTQMSRAAIDAMLPYLETIYGNPSSLHSVGQQAAGALLSARDRIAKCLTKGVEVYVRKVAPLGDPMEVTVRGYELSLRKADTEMIEVQ